MNKTNPRYAGDAVNAASSLIELSDVGLGDRPASTSTDVIGAPRDSDFRALGGTANDGDEPGTNAWINTTGANALAAGLSALDRIAPFIFNILCIPAAASLHASGYTAAISAAEKYCNDKRAFFIVDIPASVATQAQMVSFMTTNDGLRDM